MKKWDVLGKLVANRIEVPRPIDFGLAYLDLV